MATLPITFTKLYELPQLGLNPAEIKFGQLTLNSDKFLCVREAAGIAIVNLQNGAVNRRKIACQGCIINGNQILALQAAQNVQAFNMATQQRLGAFKLPDGQSVAFWRYVDEQTVAIVTNTSVLHWKVAENQPKKMFDRHDNLRDCTILNYEVSGDGKWLLVGGIKKGAGGGVEGRMQLYSIEKNVSQPLNGNAGVFGSISLPRGGPKAQVFCFAEKKAGASPKLFIMEVGRDKALGNVFKLAPQDIPSPPAAGEDFPTSMVVSKKHDVIFMVTKGGFIYMFDIHTGTTLFRNRVSPDYMFATTPHTQTNGVMCVTQQRGGVFSVSVNERNLVPFVRDTLKKPELALAMASRLRLPGSEKLHLARFQQLVQAGDIRGAATMAAKSPGGTLRTPETIKIFQGMAPVAGQPVPVLQYFSILLEQGQLNKLESIELVRPVVQQQKKPLLEKWLKEKKLEPSEELGDLVKQLDGKLALVIYRDARCHGKVFETLNALGHTDKAMQYCSQVGYTADYLQMITNMVSAQPDGPARAKKLACDLCKNPNVHLDAKAVLAVFTSRRLLREATGFLLSYLEGDRKEDAVLQTQLLEMNLIGGAAQVADAILDRDMFHHFDKNHIAQMCERARLFKRALELYTSLDDMKRVIINYNPNPQYVTIPEVFLVKFLGERVSSEDSIEMMQALLSANPHHNLKVCVDVAKQYSESITPAALIAMFEGIQSFDGLFHYLGAIVNNSTDAEVHFKYIEAAANLGKVRNQPNFFLEVERVCRDSTSYEPERVKAFLLEINLPEPRPLIHVCDRFDFIEDMTEYLYPDMLKYIQVYVTKVSPQKTPKVVGKLLDLNCDQTFITNLLNNVRSMCPVDPLVEEFEKRNKLRALESWLEDRVKEGNVEPSLHNAIGKIYVSQNTGAKDWLLSNRFYDSSVVGKFCEKLDPFLAYLAYRRAWGKCDDDLIRVTNTHSLFKDQARYLVERQDMELWGKVLTEDNDHKDELVSEVVGTALPEADNPDMVSSTVKAFMAANLPHELIGLLERLVLQRSVFSDNRNLQNLLLLTAIKAAPEKVKDFIHRLDNFNGPQIAEIAVSDEHQLYEEAFEIYKKCDVPDKAMDVLLEKISDIERAQEFAQRVQIPAVWSKLAAAQLESEFVQEAIESYIKAKDPSCYVAIIAAVASAECYDAQVLYLEMARETMKEPVIDSEMVYSLAKCDRLGDLEEFVSTPNVAKIQNVGDRLFDEKMFQAAKLLFTNIGNNSRLASCHVHLSEYKEAVDAARKANSVFTWREVNEACVTNNEFKLARVCGLHIIVSPDHLETMITVYEKYGYYDELILLLEEGLGLNEAHTGIFTNLAILYSRHSPEKLMKHVKLYHSRLQTQKLILSCNEARHFKESVFLYINSDQFDEALRTMMDHSPICFDHDEFMECVMKVRNQELHYSAIDFYVSNEPMQLNALLNQLTAELDASRVVHMMRKGGNLPLVLPYLKAVQKDNNAKVNEAINQCYVEEELFADLRESVDSFDAFDHLDLAQQIEKHELLEFRRLAAYLYKKIGRHEDSMELAKQDSMFKDAIDTAADSGKPDLANSLIRFFVDQGDAECFCAALYTCYDLIEPSVALELAWRNGFIDFAMPYLIQFVSDSRSRAVSLDERIAVLEKAKENREKLEGGGVGDGFGGPMGGPQAIGSTAYNQPPMGAPPMVGLGAPPMGALGGPPPMGAPPMGGLGGPAPMGGPPMGLGGPPPNMGGPPMGLGGPPMGLGGPPMGLGGGMDGNPF